MVGAHALAPAIGNYGEGVAIVTGRGHLAPGGRVVAGQPGARCERMVEPYRGDGLPQKARDRPGARGRVALAVFFLAAGYFLWTEHRAHTIQYHFLPWGTAKVGMSAQ